MKRDRKLKDYSGFVFGRLLALSLVERDYQWNDHKWLFKCSCGNEYIGRIKSVRSGHTSSCGCLHSETVALRNEKHGLSKKHPLAYRSWKDMRQRCGNKNNKDYKDYGGRGIVVCDEWNSFERFFSDMGERLLGQSIDRIDVNGNYELSNCRWATNRQQQLNKRTNRKIIINGEEKTISEVSELSGVGRCTLTYRLENGYTVDKATLKVDYRL